MKTVKMTGLRVIAPRRSLETLTELESSLLMIQGTVPQERHHVGFPAVPSEMGMTEFTFRIKEHPPLGALYTRSGCSRILAKWI